MPHPGDTGSVELGDVCSLMGPDATDSFRPLIFLVHFLVRWSMTADMGLAGFKVNLLVGKTYESKKENGKQKDRKQPAE